MKTMDNPKKLWKILKHIAPTKSAWSKISFIEVNNPFIGEPMGIANAFNEHFINIHQSDAVVADADTNQQGKRLSNFIETWITDTPKFCMPLIINTEQVSEDLKNIPNNKATGLDGIGTKPLKSSA